MTPEHDVRRAGGGGSSRTERAQWGAVVTVVAACAAPLVYLAYLAHFAVDAPFLDDWFNIPVAHNARHGHLGFGQLWQQYNTSRLFVGRLLFAFFGRFDSLNLRHVIFFSGVLFIAAYALLLVAFRRYSGRRLNPVSVLVIGVTWFSLADWGNSLWSFQLSWYLAVFFLAGMIAALSLRPKASTTWFAVAVLCAVAASFSIIQGFLLWPVGLVALVWHREWTRRRVVELAVWIASAGATLGAFLPGYRSAVSCATFVTTKVCSTNYAVHHPSAFARYFLVLLGNVVPGRAGYGFIDLAPNLFPFELLGGALLAVSLFIVVQSLWHRGAEDPMPLPVFLIIFSLGFDVIIASGRLIAGPYDALTSRYMMPNFVLLTAIAMYVLAHVPRLRLAWRAITPRRLLGLAGSSAFGIFLVVQLVVATNYGLTSGRLDKGLFGHQVRIAVNLDRYPAAQRGCELSAMMYGLWRPAEALRVFGPIVRDARADHLTVFRPGADARYRAKGPPAFHSCAAPGTG